METFDLIRTSAWASLVVVLVLAIWRPRWCPRVGLNANVTNVLIFAFIAMLFILAYPHSRRVVAICAILGAVGSELLTIFVSSRHAEMRHASVKALSALTGVLFGAALLQLL